MADNWAWSYDRGRTQRLEQEVKARMSSHPFNPNDIPLHSHDGTMQSKFKEGWLSVSEIDIRLRVDNLSHYKQARGRVGKLLGEHSRTISINKV
ncbi:hypothetical protein MHM93_15380 [Pseudoalteromonas sp. MM17-2]|uniref:hypothetical protein n=1 Tax=Pseudoalteromonas TaxID=53246 RepID=UPI00034BF358|nr:MULTISPECIES: hypothetical protein [Pseudoalteromonas]MCG7545563.1 hypothetical protein [Pseudoalteromonas sp. MM17-2]MCG7565871.1 hypothetical protein [Pseudoalteromonas sp. CnMc7-15]|tara:strand:+ start:27281 stop:27562 length:282 start_codon:yes stop_codon:yes gene_type:complete